jgi:hypothetical protein
MRVTRIRMALLISVSLYIAVMAFAGGVATERIRFDRERGVVLERYDEAVQQWHGFLMTAERRLQAESPVAADTIPVVW